MRVYSDRDLPLYLCVRALSRVAVLLGGAVALLPVYARDILHVGPAGLRLLRSAPALGAALTALYLTRRPVDQISVYIRATLVQFATPDAMRGRVSAVSTLFISASNELGGFESGLTAALLGTVPAVVLGGVGTLAVVALWMRAFPPLRTVDLMRDVMPAAGALTPEAG
ncbi:MAG: hypothetical protein WBW93_16175 [Steroidobacteraceae bacterium]